MNKAINSISNPKYKPASLRCVLPPAEGMVGLAFDVGSEIIRIEIPVGQFTEMCRISFPCAGLPIKLDELPADGASVAAEIASSIVVAGEWSGELTEQEFETVLQHWRNLVPRRTFSPDEVSQLIGRSLR